MASFLRYPGGKAKMANILISHVHQCGLRQGVEYRDPFFGGGGFGLQAIEISQRAWINDADPGMASLWTAVIRHPNELINKVVNFKPSVDRYIEFKSFCCDLDELRESEVVDNGFKKLALHQMSYSGLGSMSGGPIGGMGQKSKYGVGCRWSPGNIIKKIQSINKMLQSVDVRGDMCFCDDFTIMSIEDCPSLMYADPPYYGEGGNLYQFSFGDADHVRLAEMLHDRRGPWVLSYDDHWFIRNLYSNDLIFVVNVGYSITATKDADTGKRKPTNKPELIIMKGLTDDD